MIANPTVPAFRYDPYDKKFTRDGYEHEEMRDLRGEAVKKARQNLLTADSEASASDADVYEGNAGAAGFGVVLGTLGRQGSLSVLQVSRRFSLYDLTWFLLCALPLPRQLQRDYQQLTQLPLKSHLTFSFFPSYRLRSWTCYRTRNCPHSSRHHARD